MRVLAGLSPRSAVASRTGGAARVAAVAVLLAVTVAGLAAAVAAYLIALPSARRARSR